MLLGKRVITPDGEVGFISCDYAEGQIDVEIVDTTDNIVTVSFEKITDVTVCTDQRPLIGDLTPFGIVVVLKLFTYGILEVSFEKKCKPAYWLYDERVQAVPKGWRFAYANWVNDKDIDKLIEHYDLTFIEGDCVPKPLGHYDIPTESTLQAELADGSVKQWEAQVNGTGRIHWVYVEGVEPIATLAELRASGVKAAKLVSIYSIIDLD
ncbi:MAG: hypothetical protein OXM61_10950 [Candidatus Poribacteria bacterium]|nr:hypothetical protein [Candidatus Poribacteria bacterium]